MANSEELFEIKASNEYQMTRNAPAIIFEIAQGFKRCPFCGSKALLIYHSDADYWAVQCGQGVDCGAVFLDDTKDKVVEKWNKRSETTTEIVDNGKITFNL